MNEPKLCTKCGMNPAAKSHKWCNPCKAGAQQDYNRVADNQAECRAFVRGVNAMRDKLAGEMDKAAPSSGMLLAGEVSRWIRLSNGPLYSSPIAPEVAAETEPEVPAEPEQAPA